MIELGLRLGLIYHLKGLIILCKTNIVEVNKYLLSEKKTID